MSTYILCSDLEEQRELDFNPSYRTPESTMWEFAKLIVEAINLEGPLNKIH